MKWILGLILLVVMSGCKNAEENELDGAEVSENAQQVGDVMASIDEAGGRNDGGLALLYQRGLEKSFQRVFPEEKNFQAASVFLPEAVAAGSCTDHISSGFAGCDFATKSVTRTFNCTLHGSIQFSGNVVMTWGGPGVVGCNTNNTNDYIERVPNITVTGRRGAALKITKSATAIVGQRLFRQASGDFVFASDGINRKFTASNGQVLFNHTTTASGIVVQNASTRLNRSLSGGSLQVKNDITNVTCTYSPGVGGSGAVVWADANCNCPTQGTWSGLCNDGNGNTSTSSLVINGCGTGVYSEGLTTNNVIFDRCGS